MDISKASGSSLGNSLSLASVAAVISVPTAIFPGLLAAQLNESRPDNLSSTSTLASIALPKFFIGYLLILVLRGKLGWFPTVATVYAGISFGACLNAVMLLSLTLTLVVLAHMMRMTRAVIFIGLILLADVISILSNPCLRYPK